jgi:deoxyhypusine synthase
VLGIGRKSLLAAAHDAAVPVYTSSPGDSSIGMNVAAKALTGNKLKYDVNADVNETASIVLDAKRSGGKSAVLIFGGGSPKNFLLQTEPQIQEVLRMKEVGQDFFIQVTDARPDTGGLSGATPGEAVSWGKVDPTKLPDAVVCYTDTTLAMPILTDQRRCRSMKATTISSAPNPSRFTCPASGADQLSLGCGAASNSASLKRAGTAASRSPRRIRMGAVTRPIRDSES